MVTLSKRIGDKLGPGLAASSYDEGGKSFIITPMYYPNGDSITVFLRGSKRTILASDEGATLDLLRNSGFEISKERLAIIQSISSRSEVQFSKGKFTKTLRQKSAAEDYAGLCQTLMTVSGLYYHQGQYVRSVLPKAIDSLLAKRVKRKREFVRRWKESSIDPNGSFPVDYHFNGSKPARNLFYVTSDTKALLVTAVVHFLRSHNINIPTMSVVDSDASLKSRQLERLQIASNEIKFGIRGNETDIVNFVLSRTAA